MSAKIIIRELLGKHSIGAILAPIHYLKFTIRYFCSVRGPVNRYLIFGLGRSGTTWIANEVAEKYSLKDYGEILQFRNPIRHKNDLPFFTIKDTTHLALRSP